LPKSEPVPLFSPSDHFERLIAMIRFNMRDVFWSITFICFGLGGIALCISLVFRHWLWYAMFIPQGIWLLSGALIGAGVFRLFGRPILGGFIGLVSLFIITLFVFGSF
jgi:hypothetical protein